jgi:SAM-dependent methyltransferase
VAERTLKRTAAASAWADVSDADVELLIAQARADGWDKALDAYATRSPFFVKRLRNVGLGNWHTLLLRARNTRALDVGCGFGALVAGLAASYTHAFGIEMLPERLRFAALREPKDAISLVRGSGHTLPFAASSFDLVTMNGVLEWAAHYVAGEPQALQLGMLRQAARLLTPGGVLAVAIENRFALETLLGMRDTHTGLHLVPALSRRLASGLSRLSGQGDYRTYLYNLSGYEALLHEAGLTDVHVLDLLPSYNDYDFVVDPRDAATYELLWRHRWVRSFAPGTAAVRGRLAARRPHWLGRLAYAYLVLGGTRESILAAEHGLWAALTPLGIEPGDSRFAVNLGEAGSMAVATHSRGELQSMVFLSRQPSPANPLGAVRSQGLARHLADRLTPAGELEYQDYSVAGYRVVPAPGARLHG